jgi:phospholipid/cholesterol/gamma-HCH transport system permease protein
MYVTRMVVHIGEWAWFCTRGCLAAMFTIVRPGLWIRQLDSVLIGALPLSFVLGIALGVVIWLQTRQVLERTAGATELLPTVLAVAVLLELAPVGAGLIVAARSGASLGAELASMQIHEQIDALELIGVSPMRRLIAPRIIACLLAVPLLHVLVSTLAIGSGFLAELVSGSTSFLKYQTAVLAELCFQEVVLAALKTLVFGLLIGATGCFTGICARGGSEGVGRAATNSVVACCLLVLFSDVLLVGLIRAIVS